MRKLIIIPGSIRLRKEPPEPIPALLRFDGVFVIMIRKYRKMLRDCDVMILSPVFGLIKAKKKIGFKEPVQGSWRAPEIRDADIERLRKASLSTLKKTISQCQYDEIYVNLGKNMLKIIEGFEELVPQETKITFSQGRGIGPKMGHMKAWIQSTFQLP